MKIRLFRISTSITILALMLMAVPALSAVAAPHFFPNPTTTVFINEIHYDNTGTDAGEAIEIAGPAGTDLTGWSLVLYNGTGGPVYDTDPLSGVIPSQQGGYGTVVVNYPVNGVQNGSPDGIALVNGVTVVQFLSYEGTFVAVGGPANGMTSTDIGLSETGSEAVGLSLQLTGAGDNYGDFSWAAPATSTFGGPNTGQTFTGSVTLAINDVSLNEGNSGTTSFDFTVSLSSPAGPGGVTFDIATADNTATLVDNDYLANTLAGQTIPEGSSTYAFSVLVNGDLVAESNETFFVNVTNVTGATVADAQGQGTIVNDDIVITPIHDIQGSGGAVTGSGPFTVEAIVVGDFQTQGTGELRGFFIQEEDVDIDADPATSEALFVFCSSCPTPVSVGDAVRVTGGASEFFGMSQLSATLAASVSVLSSGNTLPAAASLDLPASGSTRAELTFENVEGMLVTFAGTLYVSEYFELARYGQLILTADARPAQFTDANEPSVPGYTAFLADFNSKRIILDDDNNLQNDAVEPPAGPDEPYFWPRPGLSNSNFIRGGDSIAGLTGVMHWSFAGATGTDAWRVRPVEPAFNYGFSSNSSRTPVPDEVGGSIKVASFNVLNYFTTINSRGADSPAELDRQRAKTAAAICAMDADVVGLMEIENNGAVALEDLLNGPGGINAVCGPYAYINTGVVGTDEIFQAFIYRSSTASPVGNFAVLSSSVDPRFLDDFNRPALAQTFREDTTGGIVTVVVNHLKSKGSHCNDVGDPDILDGQGNCNITRREAAAAMVDWLATDPTASGDDDYLIIGDLNSYRNEDPVDVLEAGADDTAGTADDFTDLLNSLIGPSAYTYLFDGQLGYLDHALASGSALGDVTGATVWHINADEIPVFDYNDEIRDGSNEQAFERESTSLPVYEPNAYRSSDHDPVLVGLAACDEVAPVFSELTVSPDTLSPANHKYVDVTATVAVSDNFDPNPTVTFVSVTSNEPDNGDDDGDTIDDIVIVDDFHFKLRAERSGLGTGRIYTITYTVTDACGNSTTQSATVTVPLGQGN